MQAFGTILVPVDFSEASTKALMHAISVAREFEAKLVLAHIVEFSHSFARAFPESSFQLEKRQIAEIRQQIRALVPDDVREDLNCQFVVKMGVAKDEILGLVQDLPADLIVMGTHGRRGFSRWVLGSLTEHLLRTVSVPIITISHLEGDPSVRSFSGGRMLYATDLSAAAAEGLNLAHAFAERFDASLVVFHVLMPLQLGYGTEYLPLDLRADHERLHKDTLERLEQSIPEPLRRSSRLSWELGEGVPWEVILDVMDARAIDLLMINLHSKERPDRAFLGRTAERVVRNAHRPVLAIPSPKGV